jgi:ketosteroid isomerase-like protein
MKKLLCVIPLVVLLCFTFACQKQGKEVSKEPGVIVEADVASIKASFDEWVRSYNAGDFDRIMSIFYTENSIQMPSNESIRKGKEAILLGYQKERELNDEHCDSSVVEDVRMSGDLAVVQGIDKGTSTPRSGGEPVKYSLKWLIVLERQSDGTWKWIYEMWNDNNPLPETPGKEQQD